MGIGSKIVTLNRQNTSVNYEFTFINLNFDFASVQTFTNTYQVFCRDAIFWLLTIFPADIQPLRLTWGSQPLLVNNTVSSKQAYNDWMIFDMRYTGSFIAS